MSNLWILGQHCPDRSELNTILSRFAKARNRQLVYGESLRFPQVICSKMMATCFRVEGLTCEGVGSIFMAPIKSAGNTSFVNHLVFYQKSAPFGTNQPIFAFEKTTLADRGSRNHAAYLRGTKLVFLRFYYPDVPQIMIYDFQDATVDTLPATLIFGIRMMATLGIEILGGDLPDACYVPFRDIEELIGLKSEMRTAGASNTSLAVYHESPYMMITAKLSNGGRLAHDPNVGAVSLIAACLRALHWEGGIIVEKHGLEPSAITRKNKFVYIANRLNIGLDGITVPNTILPHGYWQYKEGE